MSTTAANFGRVTATVTSIAAAAAGVTCLGRNERDFLSQVIAWPTQGESGYANLHYSMVNPKPTPAKPLLKGMGWPFRDLGKFVSRAEWVNGTTNFKDVWFCTSLQSTMKKDPKTGKLKAVRLANNALKVKSIWIDMDVGPNDPKKYVTIQDALKAVIVFRERVGLPPFSAIVGSGSGIHVYWISETALTPEEWKLYSHGLKTLLLQNGVKCDAGLTIDIARILRVPGTHNHKYDPPRPVQLLNVPLVTYNFGTSLSLLTQIAPQPSAAPGTAKPPHNPFAEDADLKSFKAGPAFKVDGPDLNASIIDKHADIPLKAEPIFKQCEFLGHALKTGGADYNNPLWHLSILASTFMEKGNEIAHAISKGHVTYSEADTQALYDRKVADRHDRGIGYPSCSTIQGAGCSACATCPLIARGKSPLNIRPVVTATVTSSPSGSSGQAPSQPPSPPEKRTSLHGGVYSPDEALELLNSHYLIGKSEQEVAIFRIKDDGSLAFAPLEQFKLDVGNVFVQPSGGSGKPLPVEKFWKESPKRNERKIVFKPKGTTEPDEFNLWRGFGVEARKGWQKQRRFFRHIWEIICRRDRAKFVYLIRWLAWAVQNPDKRPDVVIVLKSRKQGTGKSTLGVVMLRIFGPHGALIDDKERLLGRFNDWLETISFIVGEEILWARDPKTTDKIKSMTTAPTLPIERKFGGLRHIPNRLHMLNTTNHDHAVAAGVQDRRNVVYDASDERVGDKGWFDRLYEDLNDGGIGEFLYFLQNLKLGDWHPREILKTAETIEQQRMSADSVSEWSRACINADAIVGAAPGPYSSDMTHDLGTRIASEALRGACTGYCKQQGLRAVNVEVLGKACTEMFGPRKRVKAQQGPTGLSKRRPWGYDVPTGNTWQRKLDARLGIKK